MSELLGLAFLLCSRAADMGLRREDLLFLVECQFDHLENIEGLRRLDSLF